MQLNRLTKKQIETMAETRYVTKGDLFKELQDKEITFDYALPQNWLNFFSKFAEKRGYTYHFILSTTVWVYPYDKPISICIEVQQLIDEYMK